MSNNVLGILLLAGLALAGGAVAAVGPAAAPDESDGAGWLDDIMGLAVPRGERNNNPGNIRISSTAWQGKVIGKDTAFETFATAADGIRAMAKLLRNYQVIYGLNTVRRIIGRWAPSSENNTSAYVAAVAAALGVGPDQAIDLANDAVLAALVRAVIQHENGRVIYASGDIAAAVAAA